MNNIVQLIIKSIRYEQDYSKAATLIQQHQIKLEELVQQTYKINFYELALLIDEILKKDK